MTRQLEQEQEERTQRKVQALLVALEYGLVGAFESQGDHFHGFLMTYEDTSCLMTVKATVSGVRSVAFVGSDTMINCILKAALEARNSRLRWRADKYHQK